MRRLHRAVPGLLFMLGEPSPLGNQFREETSVILGVNQAYAELRGGMLPPPRAGQGVFTAGAQREAGRHGGR